MLIKYVNKLMTMKYEKKTNNTVTVAMCTAILPTMGKVVGIFSQVLLLLLFFFYYIILGYFFMHLAVEIHTAFNICDTCFTNIW